MQGLKQQSPSCGQDFKVLASFLLGAVSCKMVEGQGPQPQKGADGSGVAQSLGSVEGEGCGFWEGRGSLSSSTANTTTCQRQH